MWAVEHAGVTPDILCIAKSIGGGIPLAVVAYRADLVKELPRGFHLGTFRANPLALAAGTEVLKVLKEGDLLDRTRRRGAGLVERFRSMVGRHPAIGEVRGRGFMVGVEFVRDPASRAAWGERAKAMRSELFSRGVLMHTCGSWDQVLRFMAPLTIEDELLDRGLLAFEDALGGSEAMPRARRGVAALPPGIGIPERLRPMAPGHPPPVVPPVPGRTFPDDEPF